ncbi:MAG: GTPase ObgE [Chloroflexi bacterium]|nr:GTPase ObgE [Chloroflexota bacterium]
MIDQVFIHISSGNGGDGNISGRREKFVPRGGPDGGDGGRGGNVIALCDENINTLLAFRYQRRFTGGNGGNGASALKHGADGEDVIIRMPVGTQVWDADANPPRLLADLTDAGQTVELAHGGGGGRGNAYFASATNQYPLLAEKGETGESLHLRLELKLLADVGVIGLPNAGKSSLLSVVSAARPKVANYPFTTLEPVLGVVEHRRQTFVMVDIPGIIEGAHEGIGLGHDFLRHVERTRVLVHMIDGGAEDPLRDYRQINDELRMFNDTLASKPQVVAINKTDITEVAEIAPILEELFADEFDLRTAAAPGAESRGRLRGRRDDTPQGEGTLHFVSAATRSGVDGLLDSVLIALDSVDDNDIGVGDVPTLNGIETIVETIGIEPDGARDHTDLPVLRPKPRRETKLVRKRGDVFVVLSRRAVRIAALLNEEDWNARVQFLGYLQRAGVVRALEDAGVLPGDTVRFGEVEWEWE